MKIKAGFISSPEDPEKAILPTVIYLNIKHPFFKEDELSGFCFFVGWWHWGYRIGFYWRRK